MPVNTLGAGSSSGGIATAEATGVGGCSANTCEEPPRQWGGQAPNPPGLSGCCIDLASAFRQVPRLPAHSPFAVVAVHSPETKGVEWYLLDALAFGQKAAVYGFNRVARALDCVLAGLGIMTGNYVDDYPMVAPSETADAMVRTACEALSLFVMGSQEARPTQAA